MRAPVRWARTTIVRGRRARAFLRARRRLRAERAWSDDQRRAAQRRGLAALARSIESSPFQAQRIRDAGLDPRDLRSFDALAALPPVTKQDLLAAGLDELCTVPPGTRGTRVRATSGSTGEPFRFLVDRHAIDRGNAVRAEIYDRLGATRGPVVELFDAPLDGPGARGRRGHGTPGHDRRVVGYRLPVPEQADLVTGLDPTVLYGNRSHLLLIGEELARRGTTLPSLRLLVSSSEVLTDDDRALLGDVFGVPVHDLYGLSEVQTIGWEPVPGAGYDVVSSRLIVEVLHDGEPVAPGEVGQVVVTSIDNTVMPIVRYVTGDLARLPADRPPDSAGATTLRLEQIEGRRADSLVRADRSLVSPWQASTSTFWGRADIAAACERWQIDQHADLSITVSVVPTGPAVPDTVADAIERFVHDAVGTPVEVRTVDRVELDPNGKFRAVRSAVHPDGPVSR